MTSRASLQAPHHSPALQQYFREISSIPLLSVEQERELGYRIRTAEGEDEDAVKELITSNLRFVVSVAKKYQNRGLELADLIAEGNFGLRKAAMRFDERRGFRFISYAAWWIRQSIQIAVYDQSSTVRLSSNQRQANGKIRRAETQYIMETFGSRPSVEQLAQMTGETEETVMSYFQTRFDEMGLEDSGREDDDYTLMERLPNDSPPPSEHAEQSSLEQTIGKLMHKLSSREQEVLSKYYGLSGTEAMTLQAIGEQYGLTRERIRQIRDKALRSLRSSATRFGLDEY